MGKHRLLGLVADFALSHADSRNPYRISTRCIICRSMPQFILTMLVKTPFEHNRIGFSQKKIETALHNLHANT